MTFWKILIASRKCRVRHARFHEIWSNILFFATLIWKIFNPFLSVNVTYAWGRTALVLIKKIMSVPKLAWFLYELVNSDQIICSSITLNSRLQINDDIDISLPLHLLISWFLVVALWSSGSQQIIWLSNLLISSILERTKLDIYVFIKALFRQLGSNYLLIYYFKFKITNKWRHRYLSTTISIGRPIAIL
jgi:hypothetical protein